VTEGLILLAILVAGIALARRAKTFAAGLAVALVSLVLIGLVVGGS
jgi:hypothetical protein